MDFTLRYPRSGTVRGLWGIYPNVQARGHSPEPSQKYGRGKLISHSSHDFSPTCSTTSTSRRRYRRHVSSTSIIRAYSSASTASFTHAPLFKYFPVLVLRITRRIPLPANFSTFCFTTDDPFF